MSKFSLLFFAFLLSFSVLTQRSPAQGILQSSTIQYANEFIYTEAPFPSCHASTLVETPHGLVAAWFGGSREGSPDVEIWLSRQVKGIWTAPVSVANGVQHARKRYPCWNPVLFQVPNGPLMLFYKVGPDVPRWWGMLMLSYDHGKTWSEPQRLPEDIYGPIKNKPTLLPGNVLICPSSTEHDGWRVHMEVTRDWGKTWEIVRFGPRFNAIQGSILKYPDGSLQALHRTRESRIAESWSRDNGRTWTPLELTALPNNNSGTDAVTLQNGLQLLVYNHTSERQRSPLNIALSRDGKTWKAAWVLEQQAGEYSYPAVIQTRDGMIHITYTWKRERIKHVVLDINRLDFDKLPEIRDGLWPE